MLKEWARFKYILSAVSRISSSAGSHACCRLAFGLSKATTQKKRMTDFQNNMLQFEDMST